MLYRAVAIPVITSSGVHVETWNARPSKIICVGVNYKAHAAEMGRELPSEPLIFFKPPSSLIFHGGEIVRPPAYEQVHFEVELACVIAKTCKNVSKDDALSNVLGYTIVNDVSIRDLQKKDGQWARAKGFDTFCPIGPKIVTDINPSDLRISTRVNGEIKQDSRTSDMIFGIAEIIAFVSNVMTLEAGDVISTGTPAGVGNLAVGDLVEMAIEHIGVLSNTVVGPK